MDNLTTFERALLAEFESLASHLRGLGESLGRYGREAVEGVRAFLRTDRMLRKRQLMLEESLENLTEALDGQVRLTTNLIAQVNALLRKRGS